MKSNRNISLIIIAILLYPNFARAYVDPGIVSTLFQGLFAVVFGGITAWTMGAFGFLKNLFRKKPEK